MQDPRQTAERYLISIFQSLIDQLVEDVKHVRPAVEKTRPNVVKNPDVDRLEEDVNRMAKRWGNCCMQVVERLRSCEAACELLEKYNMSYQTETNWMDELDSKLRNLEELEEARAKEAWEKHVVSRPAVFLRVTSDYYHIFLPGYHLLI